MRGAPWAQIAQVGAAERLCLTGCRRLAGLVNITKGGAGLLLAALLAGCAHSPPTTAARAASDPTLDIPMIPEGFDRALLARAICLETNAARAANGMPPLGALAALDNAADMQAEYLALTLTLGHANMFPHEHDVADRVLRAGLHGSAVGENAIMMPALRPQGEPARFYTYREYAVFLVDGWMNSPAHRETLLARKFRNLGCAARLAKGFGSGDLRIFAIQVFLDADDDVSDGSRGFPIVSPVGRD
jgi:uncharacterized protein YkwD